VEDQPPRRAFPFAARIGSVDPNPNYNLFPAIAYVIDVYDPSQHMIPTDMTQATFSFARALREWRKRNGYSQSVAAAKLKVSTRTLQNWEQGHREPRGFALQHLQEKIRGN
jgi:hypothetical protein